MLLLPSLIMSINLSHNVLNGGIQSKNISSLFFFSWHNHQNVICCPLLGGTLTVNNLSSPFNRFELWKIQVLFIWIYWLLRKNELQTLITMSYNWSGFRRRIKVGHHAAVLCVLLFVFILYLMPTVRNLTWLQMIWWLCTTD